MDLGLAGRAVLVTGGSSGIGRAAAIAFGEEGANVALSYQSNRAGAAETAAKIADGGSDALAVRLDLADPSSIHRAVSTVVDRWGRLEVLVCNAVAWDPEQYGGERPLFEQVPSERWGTMLRTTLDGTIYTVQAALPSMRKGGWGRIAMTSSGFAIRGAVGEVAYATAKAGLHGLSRSLARELGPSGILVNIVMPGLTTTDHSMNVFTEDWHNAARSRTPSGRLSTPEEVGTAIVFACSAANGNMTGEIFKVDGGM
jgi:3-oxoacyl-[acyl-carrier protein] reductase